jgi:opacity protein-like surface antigen
MRLRTAAALAAVFLVLVASVAPAADQPQKPEKPDYFPAVSAMTTWLHIIDAGNYGESWDQASKLFQGALTRDHWISAMNGGRKPLGDLVKRYLKTADYKKALPGAPDGEYFVIQFGATYSGKADAVETVAAVLEGGQWKAAGYFIK